VTPPETSVVARLAVAGLAGLGVGIERQWSGHAVGPHARFAGVRTFLLFGLLGGVAGLLLSLGSAGVALVLLAGAAALAVAAYVETTRLQGTRGDEEATDGTTEAAALVVLGIGVLAGLDYLKLASGLAALVVFALVEKSRIHAVVERIDAREMHAALQFAVLALVVLPLLPVGPFGPFDAIRPRELWAAVLVFSGINFAGHLARRAVGERQGYGIAGLLGGIVSSTAVTLTFSRLSRDVPALGRALALGILGACTLLYARVAIVSTVLNAPVGLALLPRVLPPLLLGAVSFGLGLRAARAEPAVGGPSSGGENPLRLGSAIRMAVAFQLMLLAMGALRERASDAGVVASAVVLGLADMDALTFAFARPGSGPADPDVAATGIAVGILSNTCFKLGALLLLADPATRRRGGLALGLLALGSLAGLALGARLTTGS